LRKNKQAILFDFWQTLFVDSKERETLGERKALIRGFLTERGHNGEIDIGGAFEKIAPRFWQVYTTEQRTPLVLERLTWLMEELGIELEDGDLEELAFEFGNLGILLNPLPTENAVQIVSELSTRYPLGIVSDTGFTPGRVLRQHMERHGMLRYFTAFSFSDETGHAKPHRRQFENALELLEVAPSNAIHCGDLPTQDIRGAAALGMTTVLYVGCHQDEPGELVPDYTISDWRELPAIVAEVFG